MKHILSVQDISCVGRCSQTVALPVLSAMGLQCSLLPTALLSTHTAFPHPHRRSLTADIAPILSHWAEIGVVFDGVLVGYLADAEQCRAAEQLLKQQAGLKILDPAMGDRGKLYSGLTETQIPAMLSLCKQADILAPNVTEAALLTGRPYREQAEEAYFRELATALMESTGVRGVVITGAATAEDSTGFYCLCQQEEGLYQRKKLDKNLHGTGDLFSGVLSGSLLKGKSLKAAAQAAADFVEKTIAATEAATPYGVEFERVLKELM